MRCSVCSYVFPVEAPAGTGEHPWQIRTVEDLLFTAPDLATLRTWITEGRLHPDDQVSRTGRHWIRLGDMPEFSSVFSGFANLPQVFVEVEPAAPAAGSALDELGPPPGFGETMPVVQGVDTDILVVRPESVSDFEVPVTARSAAVERIPERPAGPVPVPIAIDAEASGPVPFPMGEMRAEDDEDDEDDEVDVDLDAAPADESAARMRPRPYTPTRRVSAIPDVVEDAPVEEVRRRPSRPTVRYGAEEVHGAASMLDVVTHVVDEDESDDAEEEAPEEAVPETLAEAVRESEDGAEVRPTAAAVERIADRRESKSEPDSASERSEVRPRTRSVDDDARRRSRARDFDDERPTEKSRRRHRTFAREVGSKPPSRTWPLIAGLGLIAGVAVVFGVPSIRAKVMGLAGDLAGSGETAFDPASLPELEQARTAMASLDPKALGEAEAALQGRLDEGKVPPAGVAAMKLTQAELLATRGLDHSLRTAAGAAEAGPAAGPSDDVERATRILGGVVAEDVLDRAHMRRVRARLRLAQGRPAAEILPLLPDDGSGELRKLVEAASLWRDPSAPVPSGVISGLEALGERSVLAELVLGLAYVRAGDETKASSLAQGVLARVPGQPTAVAIGGGAPAPVAAGSGDGGGGSTGGDADGGGDGSTGSQADGKADGDAPAADDGKAATPKVKAESVDSLIERGCSLVEDGDAGAGLDLLRKARSRRPGDLDMLLCTGMAHSKQGRTQKALDAYESALKRSASFAPALRAAAKAADKLGQTDKALRYYRRLLAQRPGDTAAKAYIESHGGA